MVSLGVEWGEEGDSLKDRLVAISQGQLQRTSVFTKKWKEF